MREVTMPLSDIRRLGREKLAGNWLPAMAVILIYAAFAQFIPDLLNALFPISIPENAFQGSYIEVVSATISANVVLFLMTVFLSLLDGVIIYGVTNFFLTLYRTRKADLKLSMSGFKIFGKTLLLTLYIGIKTLLWWILLIIPGIVAAYRYSQSYRVLFDNPELSIPECVEKSKMIMNGNKGTLFVLNLSFIGWMFLAIVPTAVFAGFVATEAIEASTVGISLLNALLSLPFVAVATYMFMTDTVFYEIAINTEWKEIPQQ